MMATIKKNKPASSSRSRATRSGEKAHRTGFRAKTLTQSHPVSVRGTDVQPTRRSTMAAEEMKKRAEEIQKTGEATAEHLKRTGEDFTRAASDFDVKGMSKAWKEGYVRGLEALFVSQEQTGLLFKETVKQGISGSRHMLQAYE